MKAIAAMDLNRVIGYKDKIPWHISEDLKWFKKCTLNHPIVMGRTTFESIGKTLPTRHTLVLTNDQTKLENKHCDWSILSYRYISEKYLLDKIKDHPDKSQDFWVCGGSQIYKQLLPYCTEVYQTIILDEYEGDVYMPEYEDDFPNSEIIQENKKFWIVRYWK